MNQHPDELPPFDDATVEREWQAQEAALHEDAGRDQPYHLLARILREPSPEYLPPDFATRVALRAAATSVSRFEFALMIGLVLALAIIAAVAVLAYGDRWAESFSALLPAPSSPAGTWLLALAGCLAATRLLERWPRRQ